MSKNTNSAEHHQENLPKSHPQVLFNLSDFNKKPVEIRFASRQISHDGGLLLLNEVEKQIGLIEKLAGCINDTRHQGYVHHSISSMLKQRIMQIAAGYEDANDCNDLRNDGILKICSGQEQALPSLPCAVWKTCQGQKSCIIWQKYLLMHLLLHMIILQD